MIYTKIAYTLLFLFYIASAQVLKFSPTYKYVGKLTESPTFHVHKAGFSIVGGKEVKIDSIGSSCNCIQGKTPSKTYKTGQKDSLNILLNLNGRPGNLREQITVYYNTNKSSTFTLSAYINPANLSPTVLYPFQEGDLYFQTNHFYFGSIKRPAVKTMKAIVYNDRVKPIAFNPSQKRLPDFIQFDISQNPIPPKDTATVFITIDSEKWDEYGYVKENFVLNSNDPKQKFTVLVASAEFKLDFNNLSSADKSNPPKARFEKIEVDGGKVSYGKSIPIEFTLHNDGRSILKVLKVAPSCGCTTAKQGKIEVLAGSSEKIILNFNASGKAPGIYKKDALIITNDPKHQFVKIKFKIEVVK